jgi:hypothetical protein
MKRSVFFLMGCLFLFTASPAFCQLVLDKREVKLEVKPGETARGSITISNPSDKEVTLNTFTQDFVYKAPYLGFKTVLPVGSTPTSCAKWITVATPVFLVPAKGKQEVGFTVSVPADAKGGYYGVLFFEKGDGGISGEKGIGLKELAGCAFIVETTNKIKKGSIEDVAVRQKTLQAQLSNEGDCVLILDGSFYIMDKDGLVADRGMINKYYLPPGEKVSFDVKISDSVPAGKYTLMVNFDAGEGKALVKEIDFSKDKSGEVKVISVRD